MNSRTVRSGAGALAILLSLPAGVVPALSQTRATARISGVGASGPVEYSPRSASRRPGLIDPLCGQTGGPAIGSTACDSQSGREWEGIASTDYFSFEPFVAAPPNPDIAAGPDDLLTVVNRTIARYPNPNAPRYDNSMGAAPVAYSPAGTYRLPPASRIFLDVWMGEVAINSMCPTQPRSNATCVIDNASVRYDQLQGRFLVLFTVFDNGGGSGTRRANWVLIVSRWATGCQGVGGGFTTACVPNTNPAVPGGAGNTEFFTTPQPPGPSQSLPNSGGINGNWIIYYSPGGICDSVAGCPYGNINDITDVRRQGPDGPTPPTIDCRASATGQAGVLCYLPTSARMGIDNDDVVVISSVINDNVPLADRSAATPAWAGSRVRLFKKAALYTGKTSVAATAAPPCPTDGSLCPGGAQTNLLTQLQGDFYDLWDTQQTPFTIDAGAGGQPMIEWEPSHLRGRSLASFSGNAGLGWNQVTGPQTYGQSFRSLIGAVPAPRNGATDQIYLYLRTIVSSRMLQGTLVGTPPVPIAPVNTPLILGGIPWMIPGTPTVTVPSFRNPGPVPQLAKLPQAGSPATPELYVGDNRPHRAISREGHLYDARVLYRGGFSLVNGASPSSTVSYDIVQRLTAAGAPSVIFNASWGNGLFYAPMFDVPANVVQYGAISPINVLPYLEKLFVGTTYPPLAQSDPRTFEYGNISGQALIACKGLLPGVGSTDANLAYPGLFDMRCGEDAYDTALSYRNAVSGGYAYADFGIPPQPGSNPQNVVPFPIRGGASTDVNNLGLWAYGAYAKGRLASIPGFGQWGTYVAFYPLTIPIRDPYNNLISTYTDVPATDPQYAFVQIARQTGIDPAGRTETLFRPNEAAQRKDIATWLVRSQMDETAITNYLNASGGIYCSFADVACPGTSGVVTDTTGASSRWRYIELMYRRGYTKGCQAVTDAQRRFCPENTLTRGEMAVFVIRAKMNQVFPTVTSGAATTSICQPAGTQVTQVGDQFGLFAGCEPYFTDVPPSHPFFTFIQKLRELRITNGTSLSAPTQLGTFGPDQALTRIQLMTFLVRAFFP